MKNEELKDWIKNNSSFSFARSGGPGGQHVNKTETKAVLHLKIDSLELEDAEKQKLLIHLANRINSEGELIIHSSSTRSQIQNRINAEEIAFSLIRNGLKSRKKRRLTRPTKASNERRIQTKKVRSKRKQTRQNPVF